ncbi:hypothetical protein BGX33_000406, partial [Mortierella sp. NVP41]
DSRAIEPYTGDRIVAVFVTKDITLESIGGRYGCSADTAGPGPRLEFRIRDKMPTSLGRIPLAPIDLWPCSMNHVRVLLTLQFLNHHLVIIKPLIIVVIVSHSCTVTAILQLGVLSEVWSSQDGYRRFGASDPKMAVESLDQFGSESVLVEVSLLKHTRFLGIIGTVAIVKYGP